MKICNKLFSIALITVLILAFALPTFANGNNITPYFNNTATAEMTFVIDNNGLATVNYTCMGYRGVTKKIVVNTVIEKQNGSSWVTVANASWTDQSTVYYCTNYHTVQLTQRGTYKATVTYTVSGSGGSTDVITRTLQYTY